MEYWFYIFARPANGVEHAGTVAQLSRRGIGPADALDRRDSERRGERLGQVELAARHERPTIDHLRQDVLVADLEEDLRAAREHGMRDAVRPRPEDLPAR